MKPATNNLVRIGLMLLLAILLGMGSRKLTDPRTAAPHSPVNSLPEKNEEVGEILRRFVLEADARHVKFRYSLSEIEIVPDMDSYNGGDLTLAQPLAYCTPHNNEIKLNDLYWDSMNEVAKEQVLFHELGHCMLHRVHREDANGEGRKLSIMSSRKRYVKNETYIKFRKEYLDELFDPAFRDSLGQRPHRLRPEPMESGAELRKPLLLEVGKVYINRLGEEVTIVGRGFVGQSDFTYEGCKYHKVNKRTECTFYAKDGKYWPPHPPRGDERDLIREKE